ncbi:hypothetical protein FRC12_013524 [Ceratobasidium sp. 428]|nr:hypothetical protein FRC12_013524 [Ceratobasidium sp. 428]
MASNSTIDVLVIGAGPAGLMCAYNLAQAGINVRIIDRRPKRLLKGQADVIQVRGIEILDSIGLASKIIPTAHRTYTYATYKADSSGHISRASKFDAHFGVESRFRFTTNHGQAFIEGVFRDALAAGEQLSKGFSFRSETSQDYTPRKVVVEQGVRPICLTMREGETEHPVGVEVENLQGEKGIIKAKYVIGCDGAHSWTRAQLGIDMVGDTSDSVWGLVDVFIDTDFPDLRSVTVVENNGRRAVLVPRENDMVRFTVQLFGTEVCKDPTTNRIDRAQVPVSKLLQLVKDVFKPYRIDFIGEPYWDGVYVIGQRLASGYEGAHGRAFIVGDACHTHSPHAGQGMNAAMSDGHNLAWKLVHVLRGWTGPDILRTYELERRTFAEELIRLHEEIGEAMSGKAQGTNADLIRGMLGFVCGTNIQYPPSRIVDPTNQALAKGIPIGQRMPHQVILRVADSRPYSTHDLLKCDFRYTLLLFTGDINLPARRKSLESFLEGIGSDRAVFKIFTILFAKKETCEYTDVPEEARPYWDTVFVDDVAYTATDGGGTAYSSLGIGSEGCAVVVRPDGHVAMIAPLSGASDVKGFFGSVKASGP